jgi:hypothetical protein
VVQIYADSYLQAKHLGAAITKALHRFKGPDSSPRISWCLQDDERDTEAVFLEGREVPTYIIEQTFRVSWEET